MARKKKENAKQPTPVLILKKDDAAKFEDNVRKQALIVASTLLVALILAAIGLLTITALIWMGVL